MFFQLLFKKIACYLYNICKMHQTLKIKVFFSDGTAQSYSNGLCYLSVVLCSNVAVCLSDLFYSLNASILFIVTVIAFTVSQILFICF